MVTAFSSESDSKASLRGLIFISYNSADHGIAKDVASVLETRGWKPFFAPWTLRPGAYWLPALADNIAIASVLLLLLGSSGLGDWQALEYQAALERQVHDPQFRIVPIVLGDAATKVPFGQLLHTVRIRDSAGGAELIAAALEAPTTAEEPWQWINPYKGLASFGEADADYFFGREQSVVEVLTALTQGARFPLLVGNSGVGKSSIVHAGVVAALRRQLMPGSADWPHSLAQSRAWLFVSFRPTVDAFFELARAVVSLWVPSGSPQREAQAREWARELRNSKTLAGLGRAIVENLPAPGPEGVVLLLDQGEEMFTTQTAEDASTFASLLSSVATITNMRVIGSLRSDHYGLLQTVPDLFHAVTRIDVLPLGKEQLRLAIAEPARALSVGFEPAGLPTELADEVGRDPGALPLLAYQLEDAWKRLQRRNRAPYHLGWSDLRGPNGEGIGSVLSRRAEDYWKTLASDSERNALEDLLTLRLLDISAIDSLVRRKARKSDCTDLEWKHATNLASEQWRLVVTSNDGADAIAELAHDVLVRNPWQRLSDWVIKNAQLREWRARLKVRLDEWEGADRRTGWLADSALHEGLTNVKRHGRRLTKQENDYILTSHRRALRWRLMVASAAGFACIAYVVLVFKNPVWTKTEILKGESLGRAEIVIFRALRGLGLLLLTPESTDATNQGFQLEIWDNQARQIKRFKAGPYGEQEVAMLDSFRAALFTCRHDDSRLSGAIWDATTGNAEGTPFQPGPSIRLVEGTDDLILHHDLRHEAAPAGSLDEPPEAALPTIRVYSRQRGSLGALQFDERPTADPLHGRATTNGRHLLVEAGHERLWHVFAVDGGRQRGTVAGVFLGFDNNGYGLFLQDEERSGSMADAGVVQLWDLEQLSEPKRQSTLRADDFRDRPEDVLDSTGPSPKAAFSSDGEWIFVFDYRMDRISASTTRFEPLPLFALRAKDLTIAERFWKGNPLRAYKDSRESVIVWNDGGAAWAWPANGRKARLGSFEISPNAKAVATDTKLAILGQDGLDILDIASESIATSGKPDARLVAHVALNSRRGSFGTLELSVEGSAALFWESRDQVKVVDLVSNELLEDTVPARDDSVLVYHAERRELTVWATSGEIAVYRHKLQLFPPFDIFVPSTCPFCSSLERKKGAPIEPCPTLAQPSK